MWGYRWNPGYWTYIYGRTNVPLQAVGPTFFSIRVARYSDFMLQQIYWTYPLDVAAGVQQNDNLTFKIVEPSKNQPLQVDAIHIPTFGGPSVFQAGPMDAGGINILFRYRSRILIQVERSPDGQNLPATVSFCCRGIHHRKDFEWAKL